MLSFGFSIIIRWIDYPIQRNFPPFESVTQEFFLVVIFAPIIETALFQYLILGLVLSIIESIFKREHFYTGAVIAAVCFALFHYYNFGYVLVTFFAGLSFNLFYHIIKLQGRNAFVHTVIVHATYNLILFLGKNFA